MEKCPKCGHWSLELDLVNKVLKCYWPNCGYQKSINVNKYLEKNNMLPKLAKSINITNKIEKEVKIQKFP